MNNIFNQASEDRLGVLPGYREVEELRKTVVDYDRVNKLRNQISVEREWFATADAAEMRALWMAKQYDELSQRLTRLESELSHAQPGDSSYQLYVIQNIKADTKDELANAPGLKEYLDDIEYCGDDFSKYWPEQKMREREEVYFSFTWQIQAMRDHLKCLDDRKVFVRERAKHLSAVSRASHIKPNILSGGFEPISDPANRQTVPEPIGETEENQPPIIKITPYIALKLYEELRSFFPGQELDLKNVLNGGTASTPLLFTHKQNQLAELFRRLKYNHHTPNSYVEIRDWLCSNFKVNDRKRPGQYSLLNKTSVYDVLREKDGPLQKGRRICETDWLRYISSSELKREE